MIFALKVIFSFIIVLQTFLSSWWKTQACRQNKKISKYQIHHHLWRTRKISTKVYYQVLHRLLNSLLKIYDFLDHIFYLSWSPVLEIHLELVVHRGGILHIFVRLLQCKLLLLQFLLNILVIIVVTLYVDKVPHDICWIRYYNELICLILIWISCYFQL